MNADTKALIKEGRKASAVVDNYEGKNYLIRRLTDALEAATLPSLPSDIDGLVEIVTPLLEVDWDGDEPYIRSDSIEAALIVALRGLPAPADISGLVEELERGLEGVTPGEWSAFYKAKYDEWHVSLPIAGSSIKLALCPDGIQAEDREAAANWIALCCSPDNIRKLIATLRARQAPEGVVEAASLDAIASSYPGDPDGTIRAEIGECILAEDAAVEAGHKGLSVARQLYVSKDDVRVILRAALLAMPSGAVKVKQLTWTEDRDTSSYASVEFGPETLFYSLSLVDEQLDAWSVETGFHCSEFGPHEVHKCVGRENARQAAQADYETRILSALEGVSGEVRVTECATEGCSHQATVHFIRGGIGSYYCNECYLRVQALTGQPS